MKRFLTPKTGLILLAVLFVVVLVAMMVMFGGTGKEDKGGFAMAVEAEPARVDTYRDLTQAVGTLVANEGVVLRSEVAGRVVEISFTEGQKVAEGAPLIRLENAIEQADLALAEQNYKRAKALAGRGAGTEQSYDAAVAQLAGAKARLAKTVLTAPFAGTVGIRQVSLGDYISPGQDLVSLQDLDSMKVDFRVPETLLARLAVGQPIRLSVSAYPGEVFAGEVTAIDPLADAGSRSIAVRARVPNPDGRLRPGLFAEVQLVLEEKDKVVFVPASAIWPVGDKSFVFKVVEGKAVMTPVNIAARQGDRVALADGLDGGEMVVTAGQVKLVMGPPGQPVPVNVTNAPAEHAP